MFNTGKILNYLHVSREILAAAISDLFSFAYVKIYLAAALAVNLAVWSAAYIVNSNIKDELVVLHYNIDFGANLVGGASQVYTIPFLGLIIIFANTALLSFIHRQSRFLAHALMAAAVLANIFFLMSAASVYSANFI